MFLITGKASIGLCGGISSFSFFLSCFESISDVYYQTLFSVRMVPNKYKSLETFESAAWFPGRKKARQQLLFLLL